MLTQVGIGLIMFGLYLLILTVARRIRCDEDLRESEARQKENVKGQTSAVMAAAEAWSRAAYRHSSPRPTAPSTAQAAHNCLGSIAGYGERG